MRQTALATLLLNSCCLLLITFFFAPRILAQCPGEFRALDQFAVFASCHRDSFEKQTASIEMEISGAENASQLFLAFEFDGVWPKIDSIQLKWVNQDALSASYLIWSQGYGNRRLNIDLTLDACRPVNAAALSFGLKVFCKSAVLDHLDISQIDGGIVQVDVIQAKTRPMETQHIYNMDGILLRTMDLPIGSPPATEGLNAGMYLLWRIWDGEVKSREKVILLR